MNKICVIGSVSAVSVSFLVGVLFATYRRKRPGVPDVNNSTDSVNLVKSVNKKQDE